MRVTHFCATKCHLLVYVPQSVAQTCGAEVWHKSVAQVWHKRVAQTCGTKVWHKSVVQKWGTKVGHKSVARTCCTKVWHKSVAQKCGTLSESHPRHARNLVIYVPNFTSLC